MAAALLAGGGLVAPLVRAAAGRLGVVEAWREPLGFASSQLLLGVAGWWGWRRLVPQAAAGGFRDWARGALRGPALAAVQMAATWLVLALAGLVGLGLDAQQAGRLESRRVPRLLEGAPPGAALAWGWLVVVAAPLAEELFFRGFLQSLLRQALHPAGAAALSAAAFAGLHGYLVHLLPLWLSGTLLGLWYERYQRLAVPVGAHMVVNALAMAQWWLGDLPGDP